MDSDIEVNPVAPEKNVPQTKNCFEMELALADNRAVIPSPLARSSVFSSMPKHAVRKLFTEPTTLATLKNLTIQQVSGSQLTQSEETVWLILVRHVLRLPLPKVATGVTKIEIEFTIPDLLRELGWPTDSQHRNALRRSILYLEQAHFNLNLPKCLYKGNLLDLGSGFKKGDKRISVWFDVAISGVFGNEWAYLNLEHRHALKEHPLAQWLLGYYSTHSTPYPTTEALLKKLAGRETTRKDKWMVALGAALIQLQAVTKWHCELVDQRMVHVNKTPTIDGFAKPVAPTKLAPATPITHSTVAARRTMHGALYATDDELLTVWLHSLTRGKLFKELECLNCMPPKASHLTLRAPDLRQDLRAILNGRPLELEARIAKLRKKELG